MIKLIKRIVLIFVCGLGFCDCYAQTAPPIQWQKCFGGYRADIPYSISQTSDGGYIIGGLTASYDGDITVTYNQSGIGVSSDYWVIKTDNAGTIQWQRCYGGTLGDVGSSIQQTSDGGYIAGGRAQSVDGDVTGNHSVSNVADYWVLKLDSSGNIQWEKCYGGSVEDDGYCTIQTADGGYITTGHALSNDSDVTGNHGNYDVWTIKTDTGGNIQWQKCYGGTGNDRGYSIIQTFDGGYVTAASTFSNDGDVTGLRGQSDYWIIKTDDIGNIQWQKCFGGTHNEYPKSILQSADGGYMVTGYTESNDSDVSGNHSTNIAYYDIWTIKLDSAGNLQWQKCFGGTKDDRGASIHETLDGGYVIAGYAASNDGDVAGNHDTVPPIQADYWVVKINSGGVMQWQQCYGGTFMDEALCISTTSDSGYVIAGISASNDGDVTNNHDTLGISQTPDYWIVKLGPDTTTSVSNLPSSTFNLQLFPNPTTGTIRLTFNTKHNAPLHCEIINIMGEKVFEVPLPTPNSRLQTNLDVSFLSKGIYLVRVGDGERWENKKLVVE